MAFRPHLSLVMLHARALANRLSESLLLIPAVMVFAAALLEQALVRVDQRLPPDALPARLRLSPEATIQLLSTIAGATITTAGVVFSLIVVSLQLASGQFSPRVMRGFFREPLGKVLMGLLAAVFTYCVLALQSVRGASEGEPTNVPDLTVNVAVLLTLMAVAFLVGYLQRVSHRQYVGTVLERIAGETLASLEDLTRRARGHPERAPPDVSRLGEPFVVRAQRSGWVQQVSGAGLLAAVPPGSVVRLETRPGAFLVRGAPLASVWPGPESPRVVERALVAAVVVGDSRTMQEDVDFGLRQLSDVALRALSPAINDPTTAIEAILRMDVILRELLLGDLPPQVRMAPNGSMLWRPWDLDHEEYVRHAFEELRLAAAPHPRVATVLVRSLRMLLEAVEDARRVASKVELERQLALTLEGCERSVLLAGDFEAVRAEARRAQDPRRLVREEPPTPPVH